MIQISYRYPAYTTPLIYPEMIGIALASYAVIALLLMKKIHSVKMDEALKNVE